MSGLKTFLCAAALIWGGSAWAGSAAGSGTLSPLQQTQAFAECAGRFSALVEFERLFDGTASERAEADRDLFVTLLEATLPDALDAGIQGRTALAWRVDAKMAQAQLLTRGTFHHDKPTAQFSKRRADQMLTTCRQLALGV